MNVVIGCVAGETVSSRFFCSIVGLLMDLKRPDCETKHTFNYFPIVKSGPLLSMARGRLAGLFLEEAQADALIMLDSDMEFAPITIYKMVDCFEELRRQYPDAGMMGGLAFTCGDIRTQRITPTLWFDNPERAQDVYQSFSYPENVCKEVAATGAACVIIAREVFEKFSNINPFHHISVINWPYLAQNVMAMDDQTQIAEEIRHAVWSGDQLGEDMSFCTRVRDAGYRIFVHTALNFDHMKSMPMGVPEYRAQQERT